MPAPRQGGHPTSLLDFAEPPPERRFFAGGRRTRRGPRARLLKWPARSSFLRASALHFGEALARKSRTLVQELGLGIVRPHRVRRLNRDLGLDVVRQRAYASAVRSRRCAVDDPGGHVSEAGPPAAISARAVRRGRVDLRHAFRRSSSSRLPSRSATSPRDRLSRDVEDVNRLDAVLPTALHFFRGGRHAPMPQHLMGALLPKFPRTLIRATAAASHTSICSSRSDPREAKATRGT